MFITQALNELYYGETNDIKKLQYLITKLREESKNTKVTKINSLDIIKDINRHIENMFGFKAYALYIVPSGTFNVYTLPVSNKIDVWDEKENLKYDKNTLKYTNNKYIVITYIHSGLLLDERFSDREITAILLHEIGHSFTSGYRNNALISNSLKIINVVTSIEDVIIKMIINKQLDLSTPLMLSNKYIEFSNKIEQTIRKNKLISNFMDSIHHIKNIIGQILNEIVLFIEKLSIMNPISIIFNIKNRLMSITPFNVAKSHIAFRNEQLSDNFATMFGYGSDLSSALSKMDRLGNGYKVEEIFNKIPIIQQMYQLMTIPVSFLFHTLNSHPETINRIKNQIDMLNYELKKSDLDPKVRKEIESDLKELNEVLDKYLEVAGNPKVDPHLYNKLYSKFMLEKFSGDRRERRFKFKSYEILDQE